MADSPWNDEVAALLRELRETIRGPAQPAATAGDKAADAKPRQRPSDLAAERELQLRLARIKFLKTVAILLFGSVVAVVLAHVIQQQQVDIERARSFQQVQQHEEENLQRYFKYTMDGDIYDRLKLAGFFQTIMTDPGSRERWAAYEKRIQAQLDEWNQINDQLRTLRADDADDNQLEFQKITARLAQLGKLIAPVDVSIMAVGNTATDSSAASAGVAWASPALPSPIAQFWPLRDKPNLSFLTGPRRFGAARSGGRLNAGPNITAPAGTPVIAPEDGKVLRGPYDFYEGTYAIDFQTDRGQIIRFGEIDQAVPPGIAPGAKVKAGDVIGRVGRLNSGNSQLSLEMYAGTEEGQLTVPGRNRYRRRDDILDPTPYLVDLAGKAMPPTESAGSKGDADRLARDVGTDDLKADPETGGEKADDTTTGEPVINEAAADDTLTEGVEADDTAEETGAKP